MVSARAPNATWNGRARGGRALALGVGLVFGGLLASVVPRRANACTATTNPEHTAVANATDTRAPVITATRVTSITRGVGPQKNGCGGGTTASSCDDVGSIQVGVLGTDDVTKPEQLGWILELDSGTLPNGLTLPSTAVRATGTNVSLVFVDGAEDDQESFEFALRVTAVDAAGNRSAVKKVAVAHGGINSCGAHVAPRTNASSTLLCVALAVALVRRLSKRRAPR